MEVLLDDISISDYSVCQEVNPEVVKQIRDVYEEKGQQHPIVVQSIGNGYEVVSGLHRVEAARTLDWKVIDVTVKSFGDQNYGIINGSRARNDIRDAEIGGLSLVLSQEFGFADSVIGDVVGLSEKTVRDKISLLTKLEESVQTKYSNGKLSARKGLVILQLPKEEQRDFARLANERGWTRDDLRANIDSFQSDTIVTLGYEGLDHVMLAKLLRDKSVDTIWDIRSHGNGNLDSVNLADRFDRVSGIRFVCKPEFGAPRELFKSYESHEIGHNEFGDKYREFLHSESGFLEDSDSLADLGKLALLGARKYPYPQRGQELFCHRYFLAAELIEAGDYQRVYDLSCDKCAKTPALPPLETV